MENVANAPGKGPIVAFLSNDEFYFSPLLFTHMKDVKAAYERRNPSGPANYETGYRVSSASHDRHKSDVWSAGITILFAGVLRSVKNIYN